MALEVCAFGAICRSFKPHLLMVLVQLGYAFLYFITEASLNHGTNPHVYVTYRLAIGGLLVFPFAYFLEKKERPKLTLALFLEIFVLSLLGTCLPQNMYFAGLRYTSPTFIAAMYNTTASLTFVSAVIFRLEIVDVKNPHGIAKILGTIISLVGLMIMTLYRGTIVRSMWSAPIYITRNTVHENWIKGSILTIATCISWSISYIMTENEITITASCNMVSLIGEYHHGSSYQKAVSGCAELDLIKAITLKKYPAQLSLTAWMNLTGGALSAVFTVFVQHKPAAWSITFGNIDFWSTIYAGVVSSGLTIFIQVWCTKHKGPVFATMFGPLTTIFAVIIAYFILGERLYMGSILGGGVVIIGLYLLLWGKKSDQEIHVKSQEQA